MVQRRHVFTKLLLLPLEKDFSMSIFGPAASVVAGFYVY